MQLTVDTFPFTSSTIYTSYKVYTIYTIIVYRYSWEHMDHAFFFLNGYFHSVNIGKIGKNWIFGIIQCMFVECYNNTVHLRTTPSTNTFSLQITHVRRHMKIVK